MLARGTRAEYTREKPKKRLSSKQQYNSLRIYQQNTTKHKKRLPASFNKTEPVMAFNQQTFQKETGSKPKSSPSRFKKWNSSIQKYRTLGHKESLVNKQESEINIENLKKEIPKLE